jgi:mRNA interferase HicA
MKVQEGYIAFVEEVPGANTLGHTMEEARENLREAVALVLEANRTLAEQAIEGRQRHSRVVFSARGMKRIDLIRHLEKSGCKFLREGGENFGFYQSRSAPLVLVPRHREVNDFLARKICDDLQIPRPK